MLASWRYIGSELQLTGFAGGVEGRCVVLEAVDSEPGYLKLGVFGVSEVRLLFSTLPRLRSMPSLALRFQKARRIQLPFEGQAFLRIQLDGQNVLDHYSITDSSEQPCLIPLPEKGVAPSGEHTLSILLLPESTTTFRIYAADIRGLAFDSEPTAGAR